MNYSKKQIEDLARNSANENILIQDEDWHTHYYGYIYGFQDAMTILNSDNPKWIDVKDRLPEKSFEFTALSKAVLTIDTNHSIEIRYFDTKRNKWVYTEPNRFVTHWMPLPNPPE